MGKPRAEPLEPSLMLPPVPDWIVTAPAETPEAAAFRSGAALAHLSQALASGDVPLALWRDRMALAAALNCAAMAGRREGQGALRDALHLSGQPRGPSERAGMP